MKTFLKVVLFLLVLAFLGAINLLVHEMGHCLTLERVGGECGAIYIYPGVEVWPLADLGQPYPDAWDNYFGLTLYARPAPREQARGFVSLMGSGSVAGLAWLALFVLFIFRPRSWIRIPLLAQSLMFLDILFYTVLPHWFGLRHFFFIGGARPEPLNGALRMGIPESMFLGGVLAYSALMLAGCLAYLWQDARAHSL